MAIKDGTENTMECSISSLDFCAKKGKGGKGGGGERTSRNKVTNYIVRKNVNFLIGDDIYFKCAMTAGNLSG